MTKPPRQRAEEKAKYITCDWISSHDIDSRSTPLHIFNSLISLELRLSKALLSTRNSTLDEASQIASDKKKDSTSGDVFLVADQIAQAILKLKEK